MIPDNLTQSNCMSRFHPQNMISIQSIIGILGLIVFQFSLSYPRRNLVVIIVFMLFIIPHFLLSIRFRFLTLLLLLFFLFNHFPFLLRFPPLIMMNTCNFATASSLYPDQVFIFSFSETTNNRLLLYHLCLPCIERTYAYIRRVPI